MKQETNKKTVLWWGRFDADYARNRIMRQAFTSLGWRIIDFRPGISALAALEATLRAVKAPDLIWLPAFRQRDVLAAAQWARGKNIPLVFDPMISAYDKQVFERRKFPVESKQAKKLLDWEGKCFNAADIVIADTAAHADFFEEMFNLAANKIKVVTLGAEDTLFYPAPMVEKSPRQPFEVLFFGSFIGLQAPEIIVAAAKICTAPVQWAFVGDGPLRKTCEADAGDHSSISFSGYLPYADLPARIHQADVLLGIFGTSDKAARVIPNKVYQSLASGRTVITRQSSAYPEAETQGLLQIPPGDPEALALAVQQLYDRREDLPARGDAARLYYDRFFSNENREGQLAALLDGFAA
ncbi:glycosyltransferase [Sneathiella sp.]|uniref:glycosyltransferase n=1 Tax=Sneathiella sp. TaxID=1964365 RepID=UPI0035657D0D